MFFAKKSNFRTVSDSKKSRRVQADLSRKTGSQKHTDIKFMEYSSAEI